MELSFQPLVEWLNAHQYAILITLAALAFIESLAIVGILVPGVALLFAAATAAGGTGIELHWVLLSTALGAIAGDGISFFLGYHFHHQIRKLPPLTSHPEWIEKGERFFKQYGLMGIVIGRFIGPIRAVMPLVAGFMKMKPTNFVTVDVISALAWAPVYVMPGYFVGASLEDENALGGQHMLFLIGTIFCGWLLAQFIWWAYQHIQNRRDKMQLALIISLGCAAMFLTVSQLMQLPMAIHLNQTIALWTLDLRHPWLDVFFVGLTQLGYVKPMVVWGAAVSLALLWQRNWYALQLWVVTILIAQWLLFGLKNLFAWQRPQLIQIPPESFAFPSGHTSMNLVFLGILAILCLPGIPWRRQKAILSSVFVLAMSIAASRLYLNVHWFSDIVGGILLGGFILSAFYAALLKKPFQRIKPIHVIAASLAAWLFSLSYWVIPNFAQLLSQYEPR